MKEQFQARMLRIHFGEGDKWQGKPLHEAIVAKCMELGMAGATVYRGIEGYGASTRIHHASHWTFSKDAPIMLTIIDTEEQIEKLIPHLDEMVEDGLIAMSACRGHPIRSRIRKVFGHKGDNRCRNTTAVRQCRITAAFRLRHPCAMDGASRLLRLGRLAQELGAEPVAEEARELAARVSEGRFYVACVGQFKRGKSTLLNALVGHAVVPTGFVPVTAVPTVIRFGDELHARVRMRDGSWQDVAMTDLKEYVTEELNPENKKAVDGAEVFVPSPLLSSGMCFVDTPGLGSVFTGNTATTQAFIPHIDAALVVVGADPPIAGEELALVEVNRHASSGFNPGDQQSRPHHRSGACSGGQVYARDSGKAAASPDGRGI